MPNKFNIDITASDKATRIFNQLRGRVTQLNHGLGQVNETAQRGAEVFRSMVPSMAALGGIGSLAGISAMVKTFGDSSMSLSNMADNLGLTTTKLQELHGAAKLTGLSVGSIDGGMKSLGTTMENAMFGRDNNALMTFKALGIEMHKTAKGGPDTHRALLDISNAIRKLDNPQAQEALASKLGVTELLPLLRQGSAGIQELEQRSKRLGMVQSEASIQGGKSLFESLTEVDGAATGLGNTIAAKLAPSVKVMSDGISDWVMENKDLIAEDVAGWANNIGNAFGFAQTKTADLFEAMHKLTVLTGDKTNNNPTSLNFLSSAMNSYSQWATGDKNQTYGGMLYDFFNPAKPGEKKSYPVSTPKERAAFNILMGTESAHRQVDKNGNPITSSKGAIGVAQVMPDTARMVARQNGIKWDENKYKTDAAYNAQLGRLYFHQLLGTYSGDYAKAYGAYNAGPGRLNQGIKEARKHGNVNDWNQYMPAETQAYVSKNMAALSRSDQGGGTQQPIKVDVTLHNAPAGTKAQVSNVDLASVRINHAMPGAATP